MEKKYRKILQGMEHLKKELKTEENRESNKVFEPKKANSIIRNELIQVFLILFILFSSIAVIVLVDKKTDFLQILAEKIDIWI